MPQSSVSWILLRVCWLASPFSPFWAIWLTNRANRLKLSFKAEPDWLSFPIRKRFPSLTLYRNCLPFSSSSCCSPLESVVPSRWPVASLPSFVTLFPTGKDGWLRSLSAPPVSFSVLSTSRREDNMSWTLLIFSVVVSLFLSSLLSKQSPSVGFMVTNGQFIALNANFTKRNFCRIEEFLTRCWIHVGHPSRHLLEVHLGSFHPSFTRGHLHLFSGQLPHVCYWWLRLSGLFDWFRLGTRRSGPSPGSHLGCCLHSQTKGFRTRRKIIVQTIDSFWVLDYSY